MTWVWMQYDNYTAAWDNICTHPTHDENLTYHKQAVTSMQPMQQHSPRFGSVLCQDLMAGFLPGHLPILAVCSCYPPPVSCPHCAISGTWVSAVTPMTDFPVSNANPDAMFLLGILKAFTIDSVADGLLLNLSKIPLSSFRDPIALSTPLLKFNVTRHRLQGEYQAFNNGYLVLHVVPPNGTAIRDPTQPRGMVSIPLKFKKGQIVPFALRFLRL